LRCETGQRPKRIDGMQAEPKPETEVNLRRTRAWVREGAIFDDLPVAVSTNTRRASDGSIDGGRREVDLKI
jgi:hypothetical protein